MVDRASSLVEPLMPDRWRALFEDNRAFHDLCARWMTGKKTFVEVGVQTGANSLALLLSDPERTGLGIDRDSDPHAPGAVDFAEETVARVAPGRYRVIRTDSRNYPHWPRVDGVIIDGCHEYDWCLADLRNAAAAGNDFLIVDDHHCHTAQLAVDEFLGLERDWDREELACLAGGRLVARLVRRRPGQPFIRVPQPDYVPTVCVPSGIGDALWALSKMPDWLAVRGLPANRSVDVVICGGPPYRAKELIERLDFVRNATYAGLQVTEGNYATPDGSYNYAPTQPYWHWHYCWLLQANKHLEQGGRLEAWLPHYATDWSMLDRYRRERAEDEFADRLAHDLGSYVVLCGGPLQGNTAWGHNRNGLWRPEDWRTLAEQFRRDGLKVVWVGAEYDRSYFEQLGQAAADLDAVGHWPLLRTLAVIDRAACMVTYQCGLGVYAAWRGVPCGMFWRPYGDSLDPNAFVSFHEGMASGWVPRAALASGRYLPLIYTRSSPESIHQHVRRYWFNGLSGNPHASPPMRALEPSEVFASESLVAQVCFGDRS